MEELDSNQDKWPLFFLRISVACCFFGWAWQHIYWDAPYREILWNQNFMGGLIKSWGVDWQHYVGNEDTDGIIQQLIRRLGWLYIGFGILALTVKRNSTGQMIGLAIGSLMLCLLSYCLYLDKMRYLAQFIEHGGQFLCPIILILAIQLGLRHRATISLAVVAFIMVFAGHGLFAVGAYPVPANFVEMTINVLHVNEETAKLIIATAGTMDFVVCLAFFIPYFRKPALIYAAVWGMLTAMARPWSGMSVNYEWWGADQYLHLMIYRMPHAVIPLFLCLVLCRQKAAAPEQQENLPTAKLKEA